MNLPQNTFGNILFSEFFRLQSEQLKAVALETASNEVQVEISL